MAECKLVFNPDDHPSDTLKQFNQFYQSYALRYNAQYINPPKNSINSAIARWKVVNTNTDGKEPTPTVDVYDELRDGDMLLLIPRMTGLKFYQLRRNVTLMCI